MILGIYPRPCCSFAKVTRSRLWSFAGCSHLLVIKADVWP